MDPLGTAAREQVTPVSAVVPPAVQQVSRTATTTPTSPPRDPEVDVVQALLQAVNRPGNALEQASRGRVRRPFDAQYWACWVVTTVGPVALAYLWITR